MDFVGLPRISLRLSSQYVLISLTVWTESTILKSYTVEPHNSGQVGCPEIVPYCGVFPYFASSLFTYGHFGHAVFVPYFAVPYCERLLYCTQYDKGSKEVAIWQIDSSGGGEKLTTWKFWHWHSTNTFDV